MLVVAEPLGVPRPCVRLIPVAVFFVKSMLTWDGEFGDVESGSL